MSLDYRLGNIKDYLTVCFDGDGNMKPVTQELVFNCLRIEMGEITEENAAEFYARIIFMTKLNGSMWRLGDGTDLKITPEDVVAHIGLSTNVPYVHRPRWLTRANGHVDGWLRDKEAAAQNVMGPIKSRDPFDDSPEPFDPRDDAVEPEMGDMIAYKPSDGTSPRIQHARVLRVYKSLAEDWGSDGESAWAMREVNETVGFKGHWYAIVECDDGETNVVTSYEVVD